jgi:ParB/RepB/Spo0J family partition protein
MSNAKPVEVAGLKIVEVATADLRPNPWNPNVEAPEVFERTIRSIQKHGFIDPIAARTVGDVPGYEIVDGEHRWRAATHLGITKLPIIHLGPISDDEAKRLTILFNELRGDPEPAKLAAILKDLSMLATPEELAMDLPMQTAEIDALIQAASFTWDSLNPVPSSSKTKPVTGAEDRRFVLGAVQGHVPVKLADALTVEYKRSGAAIGSNNIELILKDVLARLKASPPTKKAKAKANGDAKTEPAS